jgi:ubiquinone/menaquinone biosynthesis C-methylase UbiE
MNCPICNNTSKLQEQKTFLNPPLGEPLYKKRNYKRTIFKCKKCNHFINISNINFRNIYKNNYSNLSYGNNLLKRYNFLISLKKKSDNYHRVNRVKKFLKSNHKEKNIKCLDIGSGFGLFPITLKKELRNINMEVIEPDINNIKFMKKFRIKIKERFIEDFKSNNIYNFVSLNKVLEHIKSPGKILKKINKIVNLESIFYLEVPDGEGALKDKMKFEREEFFADHHHVFSKKSFKTILIKSGFKIKLMKKIKEPSSKYTLFAFVMKS